MPYPKLLHQVAIISHDEKKVSSSEAHRLIHTSPLYNNRPQRAKDNLKLLLDAFYAHDWASAYAISWREFQDMHSLFSTSNPPFTYMTDASTELLSKVQKLWQQCEDGPIVTMDAGPNVHLLYRPDQAQLAQEFKLKYLVGNYDIL